MLHQQPSYLALTYPNTSSSKYASLRSTQFPTPARPPERPPARGIEQIGGSGEAPLSRLLRYCVEGERMCERLTLLNPNAGRLQICEKYTMGISHRISSIIQFHFITFLQSFELPCSETRSGVSKAPWKAETFFRVWHKTELIVSNSCSKSISSLLRTWAPTLYFESLGKKTTPVETLNGLPFWRPSKIIVASP